LERNFGRTKSPLDDGNSRRGEIEEAAVCKAEMPTTKFFQVNFGGKADSMLSDENTRTFCHSLRHFFLIVLLFSQPFRAQKPRRIANFERRNARFE